MRKIYKNNISRIATMEFLIFHKFEFAKFYSFQDTVHDVLVVLLLDEQRRPSYLQRWIDIFEKNGCTEKPESILLIQKQMKKKG